MAQMGTLPYKDALLKMREKYQSGEPKIKKEEDSPKGFFERPKMNNKPEVEEESIQDYLQEMFNVISENNLLIKQSVVKRDS
tara:strand:- start:65 stop:310 length:246 start_codon:yes stop_codon:yes gene_type:complete